MPLYDRDYMREPSAPTPKGLGPFARWDAFHWILAANTIVFVAQYLFEIGWVVDPQSQRMLYPMGAVSVRELSQGHVWTIFTYMFVHGSLGHYLLNMVFYWFVGRAVYQLFGARTFLQVYVVAGLAGAILEMAVGAWISHSPPEVPLVGASASIFGLLMAMAVAIPEERITVFLSFIIPIQARMWRLAMVMVSIDLGLGLLSLVWKDMPESVKVAHFAHVGGALAGWYLVRILGYGGKNYQSLLRSRRTRMSPAYAGPRRSARVINLEVDVDVEAARRQNPKNDPIVDIIEDDVHPILDKISDHGMGSLTDDERRILERASREISRRGKNH